MFTLGVAVNIGPSLKKYEFRQVRMELTNRLTGTRTDRLTGTRTD